MPHVHIQSTTAIPIYDPKLPLKVLTMQFPHNVDLIIRLVSLREIKYLQFSIFGQPQLPVYFYDLFDKKTVEGHNTQFQHNAEELFSQLFELETQYFSIQWPKRNGNAYVQVEYGWKQRTQWMSFQVSRRNKDFDTLLGLKIERRLLQLKEKKSKIDQAENRINQLNRERVNLLRRNNQQQPIDLVGQSSEEEQSFTAIKSYKRRHSNNNYVVAARKKIIMAPSHDTPVQQYPSSLQNSPYLSSQQVTKAARSSQTKDKKLTKSSSSHSLNQKKLRLDFSQSQYIQHFKIRITHKHLLVTKAATEKKFFHLHHRFPITQDTQEFKLIPQINAHNDITFGILGADALKVNRSDWPMSMIAYIGCTYHIMKGLVYQKVPVQISEGDLFVLRVNLPQKKVYFLRNDQPLGEEVIAQEMTQECYFFYQTSTEGNSVKFLLE